ncbi:four helix bundle protein [Pseudotenacibaculum haliotis]|uniref:Four helix bundle protein n=1 Tax=Pseudotenacibaculum haliotis TaxID=1862138 RepID=A0ABW5LP58_9FLAO
MKLKNNPLQNKSYDFALTIIKLSKSLMKEKKEFILSKQLLRSGTSIGANIVEANGAISTADFSAKMSISYKESLETKYWLSLLKDSGYLLEKEFSSLYEKADEISKILFSILKTTRINKNKK